MEWHFTTVHKNFEHDLPTGSSLRSTGYTTMCPRGHVVWIVPIAGGRLAPVLLTRSYFHKPEINVVPAILRALNINKI
ncbi:hypothetical protein AAFF_G00234620 [Aldrovandia affinis]|uniref:Uncharacterized protein n=1 Tax=Aldrovandia affinis TaxID=143900 RepID=A0AAD7SUV9_9TELE|nr:hypothetical protein AAFF_G00234620 [Aldrovandia affinis]